MPDKDLTGVRSWTRVGDRERRKGKTGSGRVKGKKGIEGERIRSEGLERNKKRENLKRGI